MFRPQPSSSSTHHILFIDGECSLCTASVRTLARLDKSIVLRFASMQGETAALLPDSWKILRDQYDTPTGAVVLVENPNGEMEIRWQGADAILRAFYLIGGVISCLWIFHFFPAWMKSSVYKCIAKNRHRYRANGCPLSSTELQNRFLP